MLEGINILTGDQGNETVLDEWILTYPEVDLIQSSTTVVIKIVKFGIVSKSCGPQLNLVDFTLLKICKLPKEKYRRFTTDECDRDLLVLEKLKDYMDELIYDTKRKSDFEFIFCQSEACVLGKRK